MRHSPLQRLRCAVLYDIVSRVLAGIRSRRAALLLQLAQASGGAGAGPGPWRRPQEIANSADAADTKPPTLRAASTADPQGHLCSRRKLAAPPNALTHAPRTHDRLSDTLPTSISFNQHFSRGSPTALVAATESVRQPLLSPSGFSEPGHGLPLDMSGGIRSCPQDVSPLPYKPPDERLEEAAAMVELQALLTKEGCVCGSKFVFWAAAGHRWL
jgi:hypothetical protein